LALSAGLLGGEAAAAETLASFCQLLPTCHRQHLKIRVCWSRDISEYLWAFWEAFWMKILVLEKSWRGAVESQCSGELRQPVLLTKKMLDGLSSPAGERSNVLVGEVFMSMTIVDYEMRR
jgi:hypothetical protein